MRDWTALRQRYQQDEPAVRLGSLASNLNRIAWYAQRANQADAGAIFRESKYFTEWAAPRCDEVNLARLAQIQRALAAWERSWTDAPSRVGAASEAERWSDELLRVAGLTN